MTIRKATIDDAKRISYLIRKNADHVLAKDYSEEQLIAWKRQQTIASIRKRMSERTIFCAFQSNKLVGTVGLEGNNLVGLYISYLKRGQGLGYKLLTYIENYAKKNNINQLYLTSTPNGYGFYLKNGYEPLEKATLYYNNVAFIETKMTKNISQYQEEYKLDFDDTPWVNIQLGMSKKKAIFNNTEVTLLKLEFGFVENNWCDKPHYGFVLEGQFKIDFKGKVLTYKKGDRINIQGGAEQLHKAIIEKGDYVELILIDGKIK